MNIHGAWRINPPYLTAQNYSFLMFFFFLINKLGRLLALSQPEINNLFVSSFFI